MHIDITENKLTNRLIKEVIEWKYNILLTRIITDIKYLIKSAVKAHARAYIQIN